MTCCRAATRSSPAWIAFSIAATSRTLVEGTWLKTLRYQCTMQRCHAAAGKNSSGGLLDVQPFFSWRRPRGRRGFFLRKAPAPGQRRP